MERWRWMPHDLGKTYVMVNLPDYTLRVMHNGEQVWKTKIVDGKPGMPTPIMTAMMKFITINPIWHVPPSTKSVQHVLNNRFSGTGWARGLYSGHHCLLEPAF